MEITEQVAWQAIHRLAATDVELGRLRAQVEAMNHQRRIVRADLILEAKASADLKNATERTAWAEAHQRYKEACREHVKAIGAWEALRTQHETWKIQIEMWRSVNASRRQGNV